MRIDTRSDEEKRADLVAQEIRNLLPRFNLVNIEVKREYNEPEDLPLIDLGGIVCVVMQQVSQPSIAGAKTVVRWQLATYETWTEYGQMLTDYKIVENRAEHCYVDTLVPARAVGFLIEQMIAKGYTLPAHPGEARKETVNA